MFWAASKALKLLKTRTQKSKGLEICLNKTKKAM